MISVEFRQTGASLSSGESAESQACINAEQRSCSFFKIVKKYLAFLHPEYSLQCSQNPVIKPYSTPI
jgi:hypothetical protein